MTPPRWKLILAFASVYLIWGSTYLAISFAIETMPPFLMSGTRFLIAAAFMVSMARLQRAAWPRGKQWLNAIIVGVLLLGGGNGGVTYAELTVPTGLAALLIASTPFWMVLLDWLRPGGQRPAFQVLGGVLLGVVGIVLLIGPGQLNTGARVDGLGTALLLLASFSWALGSIYSGQTNMPKSPVMSSGVEMVAGGLALVLLGLATGEPAQVNLSAISPRSILSFVYLIIFGSLIGYTSYSWLLHNAPPALVSTYAYVNPVVAVFLGWAFAGEALTPQIIIGATVIIISVAIITTNRARPDGVKRRVAERGLEIGD